MTVLSNLAFMIAALEEQAHFMLQRGRPQKDTIAAALDFCEGLRANKWSPQAAAMLLRQAARKAIRDGAPFIAAHMDMMADHLDPASSHYLRRPATDPAATPASGDAVARHVRAATNTSRNSPAAPLRGQRTPPAGRYWWESL